MQLKDDTHQIQSELAAYCRGQQETAPVERQDRLHHYKRLVYNNVYNVIESAYPIAFKILGKQKFNALVKTFFAEQNPVNPQYWKFPQELISFVRKNQQWKKDCPYLVDLLIFEWSEIEVHAMPNISHSSHIKSINDVLDNDKVFKITPYHKILELDYPIQRLIKGEKTLQTEPTFILVFRKIKSFEVEYLILSPLSVIILNLIQTDRHTKISLLKEVQRITSLSMEQISQNTPIIIDQFIEKQIIARS